MEHSVIPLPADPIYADDRIAMPKSRIMILATMTGPSGAPIAALRLAAGLSERGHHSSALFLYDREPMNNTDFPSRPLLAEPPKSPLDYALMTMRLRSEVAAFRPDTMLFFLPLAATLGSATARAMGVPRRIVSHRVPCNTYTPGMSRLDSMAARTGLYTDVIAVSGSVARSCAHYPAALRNRTHVVYNGLKGWKPSPLDKASARNALGLAPDGVLAVAVGRIDPQKNYPVLIDAMAQTNSSIRLAIAGDGADRPQIEAQIARLGVADRVTLLGAIDRDAVPHLLAAGDVFVQPSLFEGQSNALLEALHAGLPCYVSDAPEQVETIAGADGVIAGAVLPVGDATAWANALNSLHSGVVDPALKAAITRQADLFTFDRMMAGFAAVIDG